MKYKKLLIILSSVVGAVLLCFILSFTLFRVTTVELNFKNGTTMYASAENQERVINSGKFSYSTPIFAVNKQEIIDRLEKENYYLNVINIETVFPNKLIVHCAEREEFFAIKLGDNSYFICDQELKVLRFDTAYDHSQQSAVLLSGVDVTDKSVKAGGTLSLLNNEELIKSVSDAFAYNNKTIADVRGMFKHFSLTYEMNYYTLSSEPVLTFTTFDDFDIKITLPGQYLVEKLNIMLALVPKSYPKYKTHRLLIEVNPANVNDTHIVYEEK